MFHSNSDIFRNKSKPEDFLSVNANFFVPHMYGSRPILSGGDVSVDHKLFQSLAVARYVNELIKRAFIMSVNPAFHI